jgi:hypothetical protein
MCKIFFLIKAKKAMKHNISTNSGSFKIHPTHSPEEVLAAGGTTAFSLKSNKNTE